MSQLSDFRMFDFRVSGIGEALRMAGLVSALVPALSAQAPAAAPERFLDLFRPPQTATAALAPDGRPPAGLGELLPDLLGVDLHGEERRRDRWGRRWAGHACRGFLRPAWTTIAARPSATPAARRGLFRPKW